MCGHRVRSPLQILHVKRQKAEHQLFYFPLVLLVVVFYSRFRIVKTCRAVAVGFLQSLDVAVQHGQELYRVQLLALEFDFYMQPFTAQSHRLSGFHPLSELCEHIRQKTVCHLVPAVTDCLANAVYRVVSHARHDATGHSRQYVVPRFEVYPVMKELFSRCRVYLLAVTERQFHVFSPRLFERHTVTAVRVQDHFFRIFHCDIYFLCVPTFSFLRFALVPPERVSASVSSIPFPREPCGQRPHCCR